MTKGVLEMIKINDRFEFERGDQCWNLYEWKDGINPKTKEPTRSKTNYYYSRLEKICNAVIDKEAGEADSMAGLLLIINMASVDCVAAINRMSTD